MEKANKNKTLSFKQDLTLLSWLLLLVLAFIPLKERSFALFPSFFNWQKQLFERSISFPLNIPTFIGHQGYLNVTEILLLMLGLYTLTVKRKFSIFTKGPTSFLLLFLITAFVSIAVCSCRAFFFPYFTLLPLTSILFGFALISECFQNKRFAFLAGSILITLGLMESVVASFQFFFQKSMGLRVFGEHKLYVDTDFAIATYPMTNALRSILSFFHHVPETRAAVLRSYGTMNHPNILAGFLLLSSMVTLDWLFQNQKTRKKLFLTAAFCFQTLALIFTFSRGGLIAFILASTFQLILHTSKTALTWRQLYSRHRKALFTGCACLITMNLMLLPFYQARGGLFHQNKLNKAVDSYRFLFQKQALVATLKSPIIGNGYSCYTFFPAPYLSTDKTTPAFPSDDFGITRDRPHNVFLMLSAETGLIGLSFFLAFLAAILLTSWRYRKYLTNTAFASTLVGFMFIHLVDIYPLSDFEGKMTFFMSAALAWGAACLARAKASKESSTAPSAQLRTESAQ